jgi:Tc5 transposase DNA-binding domain
LEKILFAWIVDQRKLNAALTEDVIREEAKIIHANLSKEEALPPFRATSSWFRLFKKRYGIKILPVEGSSETYYETSDKPTKNDSLIDEFNFETQDTSSDVTPSDVEEEKYFELPASSPPRKKFKRPTNRDDEESTTAKDADSKSILRRLEIERKKLEIKNLNLDIEKKEQEIYHRKLMIQHTKMLMKKAQGDLDDMDNYFEDDPLTEDW